MLFQDHQFILHATVNGEDYYFNYDESKDVWAALDEFWHDDWEEYFATLEKQFFPIDIVEMVDSKVINTYNLVFEMSWFHHFYDHGGISVDEFNEALLTERKDFDENKR